MANGTCSVCGAPCSPYSENCSDHRSFKPRRADGLTIPEALIDPVLRWEHIRETEDGCWEYQHGRNSSGYGYVAVKYPLTKDGVVLIPAGKSMTVHRLVYLADRGRIADDVVADHLCRNRACCNPDHIELVTEQQNILRGLHDRSRARAVLDLLKSRNVDETTIKAVKKLLLVGLPSRYDIKQPLRQSA